MIDDGEIILESSIIITYIDEVCDGPGLQPETPLGRARMAAWLKRADDILSPGLGMLTYTVSMRPELLKKSPEDLSAYLNSLPNPTVRARRKKILDEGLKSDQFKPSLFILDKLLADMESTLQNQSFLASDIYTLADAAIAPFIERLDELTFNEMWDDTRPCVADWWDRLRARDSYDKVLLRTPNPEKPQHQKYGAEAWPELKAILAAG